MRSTAPAPISAVPATRETSARVEMFTAKLASHGITLRRIAPRVLQLNIGKRCTAGAGSRCGGALVPAS